MLDSGVLVQSVVVWVPEGAGYLDVVAAAASASVLAFGAGSGPVWDEWLSGSFTKSVRKVKKASLVDRAVRDGAVRFDGRRGVLAAAFPPMRYRELPRYVARARVQGWDVPVVESSVGVGSPCVLLGAQVGMSAGKGSAQAAHALMAHARRVRGSGEDVGALVSSVSFELAPEDVFVQACAGAGVVIRDNGLTEVEPGTVTACVVG